MTERFAPVQLRVDTSKLSSGDRAALVKLIEAGRVVNRIFMQQLWSGNLALYDKLRQDNSPVGKARLDYFLLNKGPFSDLDAHKAFLPGVPARKPSGANFYPENMTREEFEAWAKTLSPAARAQAEGFFTVIRRGPDGKLRSVPYSEEYKTDLAACASDLRAAAKTTDNPTLKHFLETRAAAFLSNDYYASDVAWMDLDAPLDITIGPYETYNDEIFGYKAAFEAYINVRDEAETAKLKFFGDHMQEVENNLPIDPKYRNAKIGALSPIRVVNEVFAAGDGDHGVQTAAYNLPNDERVVHEKGSKRVMLQERSGSEVPDHARADLKNRVDTRRSVFAQFRFLLYPYPGARDEPWNRTAPDHRQWPRIHAASGTEGPVQCDRRGQSGRAWSLHAAAFLRPWIPSSR